MNSCSIGIELDNNGKEPFSDDQIRSLLSLLGRLKKDYNIPAANFIGHSDYAPKRKVDPGILFPWKKLSDAGFGIWYSDTRDSVASNFNYLQALRIIGYDTKDTAAAIHAFKQHFMQSNAKSITEEDKSVLYNLMMKY
jgi:N-acetylmuramoyl-L-alanine amidase